MEHDIPVNFLFWSLALLPLVLLLVMLLWLKWSGPVSGGVALLFALAVSVILYDAPWDNVLVGLGKGAWEAFFILLVVWPALLLYHVSKNADAFSAIREGIQEHSRNYLFLVLAFGWVFSSFLQGIAGFGAPIAVVAPLLVGIGVKPVMAVVIPIIGHIWANMFGTLAVGWIATLNAVSIEAEPLTALYTGILLWIPNLIAGFMICWLFAKWKGVKEGFWAVIIISVIHGGGQLAMTQINTTISTFLPTIIALVALYGLSKWSRYEEKTELEDETDILEEDHSSESGEESKMSLHEAFMPYYVLTILSVIMLGIPFIHDFLDQFEVGFPVPETDTGYGFEMESESVYSPIAPFTHPGIYLLISTIFAYIWFRKKGRYEDDANQKIKSGTVDSALGASLAILGFLTTTKVMEQAGQVNVLALGIAEVSPPVVYAMLASVIGILGAVMTSSNTSSNVLFSPLHNSVVESMDGLSQAQVIASQSVGGAIGNAIAPANIILGTSTINAEDKYAEVFKICFVFVILATMPVAALATYFHLFLP